jgi:hypothetical protein
LLKNSRRLSRSDITILRIGALSRQRLGQRAVQTHRGMRMYHSRYINHYPRPATASIKQVPVLLLLSIANHYQQLLQPFTTIKLSLYPPTLSLNSSLKCIPSSQSFSSRLWPRPTLRAVLLPAQIRSPSPTRATLAMAALKAPFPPAPRLTRP